MNKKYVLLIEIVIWLLILSSSLFFFIYKTTVKNNIQNTYYIFFEDVDGLVKGSAVRLMGINIGYVRDVKIYDNKVFVSFLVTKDDVVIPKQAIATIEFYGLGGSVSLEINPSRVFETEDKEEIIPSESYRVQDFWDGQKLVANVMIEIYGGIGRTINSTGIIDNKELLKQSLLIKEISNQTQNMNKAQAVIIHRLNENTLPYLEKKEYNKLLDEEEKDNIKNITKVEENE